MPYMMGCFPDHETSLAVAGAYADSGADLIELGIPFSDPLADGPTIHAAATAALGAAGQRRGRAGDLRSRLRSPAGRSDGLREHGPRPRRRRGVRRPRRRGRRGRRDRPRPAARRGGGDPRRLHRRRPRPRAAGRADHSRRAPRSRSATSPAASSTSSPPSGTTGEREVLPEELADLVAATKAESEVPVAVGFGIGTPEQAAQVGRGRRRGDHRQPPGPRRGRGRLAGGGRRGGLRVPARDPRRPRR